MRLVFVTLAVMASSDTALAALSKAGSTPNKLSVTFGLFPDPLNWLNFFPMPRTLDHARSAKFSLASTRNDNTTVWCKDYRLCLLFDAHGSVAGIQMAVAKKDLQNVPSAIESIPEWQRQTLLDEDVYSATVFFLSEDKLLAGGRVLADDSPTAPDGIFILRKDGSRLQVSTKQSEALAAGFHEQNCFNGMGKHYFQLNKSSACESAPPYFLLFGTRGQRAEQLDGFGFSLFGKPSRNRWFEAPPAAVAQSIVPNSPDCLETWIQTYGLTTFHVYFVDKPHKIRC